MMDNLIDIYYLGQLIIQQIFIYLRNLILREFSWLVSSVDDFEDNDSKTRIPTPRHITADFIAFGAICLILFLLMIFSSKCERREKRDDFPSTEIETMSVDDEEDPYGISSSTSILPNSIYACGDSLYLRGKLPKINPTLSEIPGTRSTDILNFQKKSFPGSNVDHWRHSQSTQTLEKTFQRTGRVWLIRRTRSGQIYGKYPI